MTPRADYTTLLDEETRAFVRRTERWYPPGAADFTVERQREIYDAMCREFRTGLPEGVTTKDEALVAGGRSIPLRRYRLATPADTARVVYLHGGGFVVGGLDSHAGVCAELCAASGFEVTAVDYRLAPEHPHPAAFDDARDAVVHEGRRADSPNTALPIVLCGDSAGGNLAAAVAHHLRDEDVDIAGQVLIYPGLGGNPTRGSYVEHARAPMLTTRDVLLYSRVRANGEGFGNDPSFAPLADTDFGRLPPTVVVTAACDPLSDDGREYVARIVAAGGRALHVDEPGLVHGYLRARTTVERARRSFARITGAVAALGAREWPIGAGG